MACEIARNIATYQLYVLVEQKDGVLESIRIYTFGVKWKPSQNIFSVTWKRAF